MEISMYNILIVDDEKLHRKGLLSLLEEICPKDMIWEAADGTEALDILEYAPCHIIISDIKMTKMDGISLLKKVKEKREEIFFILLSGYAEFSYAREALSLRASAYLLKPVNRLELQKVIQDVKHKIKIHMEQEEKTANLEERLKETVPVYVERILNQFIQNADFVAEEQLISLLPLRQSGYLFLTKVEKSSPEEIIPEEEKREIRLLIKKYFDPISSLTFEVHHMTNTLATFVLDKKLPEEKMFWNIKEMLKKNGYKKIVFALSCLHENLYYYGARAYEEANMALSFSFYEENSILCAKELKNLIITDSKPFYNKKFNETVQSGKIGEAKSQFEKMLTEAGQRGRMSPEVLKRRTVSFFYQVLKNLEPMLGKDNTQKLFDRAQLLIEVESLQDLIKKGSRLIFLIEECIWKQREGKTIKPIHKCKEYLEKHYMEEISLEIVAGVFHFNPSYFSTLFKNTFGKSFSDYLSQIRMEKAEELLLQSDYKIKEVALKVGYRDSNYFIRTFKKKYGITPDEFRRKGED